MKDSISLDKSFWSMHITMATNNLLAVVQYLNRKYANDLVTETTNEEIDETTDHGFEDGGINKIKRLPIFARFGIEDKNTDSSHNKTGVAAENQKSDNHTDIVLQSKISDDLIRYFPFLREIRTYYEAPHQKKDKTNIPASQLSPHNIVRYFLDYAELLNKKRNEYVHARHDKKPLTENDRKRLYGLNRLIEFHRRTIKERFYKTVNNQTADKLLLPLTPKIVVSRTAKDNPEYLCSHGFFNENETDLSPVGLAFFVAQFLEPKYISELVQGLFPKKPKEIQQLFIRAFSVTHIVLPRTRLISDSEFSPQTIGMDILSEIHKCPEELFDMLSPTRQEEFRFIDEETQTDNLMKRFGQNRTETLMLRYLDVKQKFAHLRFHICTGAFFNADYKKFQMIDGSTLEHRRLSKRIFCFDRIQKVLENYVHERDSYENAKNQNEYSTLYWFPQIGQKPPQNREYRTDMIPQYVIGQQGIGLTLAPKSEPSFETRGGKHNRIKLKNPIPDAWLSPYELPIITFLAAHGKAEAVENTIKDFCTNWNKLRQAIADGKTVAKNDVATIYHLRFDDLPANIRQYIDTGTINVPSTNQTVKEATRALRKMIADTQRKLDNFRKERNMVYKQGGFKQGKKSKQSNFTSGNMASFIVRDVIKLQKPNENDNTVHKGKITSANFQILQRSLAFFKPSLKQLFDQAGLTKNPAFIEKILASDMTSLDRFYENYLNGKIDFLKQYLYKNNPQDCYILRRRFVRNKKKGEVGYITKWAKARAENVDPVNLPRGLFTGILTDLIKEKFPEQFNNLPIRERHDNGKKFILPHNTTFLIQKFHEWNEDGSQWFYAIDRDAMSKTFKRLTNFLKPEKARTSNLISGITKEQQQKLYKQWLEQPNLTTLVTINQTLPLKQLQNPATPQFKHKNSYKEKYEPINKTRQKSFDVQDAGKFSHIFSAFSALEAKLRHQRMQDIVLFAAMRELLDMKTVKGIHLKNIDTPKQFLLSEADQLLTWKYRVDEKEYTITGKMKPKNFGNFRRIVNDLRLPSLLRSLAAISQKHGLEKYDFDYVDIENEFAEYDRGRREVFHKIHQFENTIIKKCNLQPKRGYIDFRSVIEDLAISDAEKRVLSVYRNAFAHHKYPEFTYKPNKAEMSDSDSINAGKQRFEREQNAVFSCNLSDSSFTKHVISCFVAIFDKALGAVQ